MIEYPTSRSYLIHKLGRYLLKPKIKMKVVMKYYRDRLEQGQNLTLKQFKQLVPFLRIDLNMGESELINCFHEILEPKKRPKYEGNTLEPFYTQGDQSDRSIPINEL
jgi:hypothetical protein